MMNQYNQKFKDPIRSLFETIEPVTKETYLSEILKITKFNENNLDNLNLKYNYYIELFNKVKNNEIRSKTLSNLTIIGIFSKTNLKVEYWIDRGYDINYFNEFLNIRQSTNTISAIKKKNKCSDDEALKIFNDRQKRCQNSINNREDIADINYRKGNSARKEYWLLNKINKDTGLLYTEEELKIEFNKRYGWRSGLPYTSKDRLTNNCCIEYWLNKGFNINEAKEKLKERQITFSLEKCIDKYGEEEGLKRFIKRQEKWQNTLNSKSEEEKLEILIKKVNRSNFYSNESIIFFEELILKINEEICQKFTYYYKDNEYFINDTKFYMYDFTIKELKIIIEYNGSHVHPNKDKLTTEQWNNWKNPFNKDNADIAYDHDKNKINAAKNKGFDVLIIWDFEVKNNKNNVITNILNHIKQIKNKK